jgi:hypothetical protein
MPISREKPLWIFGVSAPNAADKKRSPCAAEGEEKRDNTQGLEGITCILTIHVPGPEVKRILP